jgi:hypothetical protein
MMGVKMKKGDELRDHGIQLSLFNAERNCPDWHGMAMRVLGNYIRKFPGKKFQAEDLRAWAYAQGLPEPPSHRAWGSVIVSAKRKGIIQFVGYENVDNPRAHSTPASVWKGGNNEL